MGPIHLLSGHGRPHSTFFPARGTYRRWGKNGGGEMIFFFLEKSNIISNCTFGMRKFPMESNRKGSVQQWNQKQKSKALKHEIGFVAAMF